MNSPLSNPLLNKATLLIPIANGAYGQNEDGNWVTDETIEEYSVYFKKPSTKPETNNNPGSDGFSVYLQGYLVKPKFLPANIRLPFKAECTRFVGKREQKGIFEIRPSIVPVELVEEILGQAVEGWFYWK